MNPKSWAQIHASSPEQSLLERDLVDTSPSHLNMAKGCSRAGTEWPGQVHHLRRLPMFPAASRRKRFLRSQLAKGASQLCVNGAFARKKVSNVTT